MLGGLEGLVIEGGRGEEAALGDRALGLEFLSQTQRDQPEWTIGGVEDLIFGMIVRRTLGEQEKNRHQMLKEITESMLSSTTTKQRINPR